MSNILPTGPIPALPSGAAPTLFHISPENITSKELKDWFVMATKVSEQMFRAMKAEPGKLEEYVRQQTLEKLKNVPHDPVILGIYTVTQATAIIYLIVIGIKKMARL